VIVHNSSNVEDHATQFKALVGIGLKVSLPVDVVIIAQVVEYISKLVQVNEKVS
jgi:hypothetical protein